MAELKFEPVDYGQTAGILLNGSLLSRDEILPFLQEFARVYDINERAAQAIELKRYDEALSILQAAGQAGW